jgi:hypothetical protein
MRRTKVERGTTKFPHPSSFLLRVSSFASPQVWKRRPSLDCSIYVQNACWWSPQEPCARLPNGSRSRIKLAPLPNAVNGSGPTAASPLPSLRTRAVPAGVAIPWCAEVRQLGPRARSCRAWPPPELEPVGPVDRSPRRRHGPAISAWIATERLYLCVLGDCHRSGKATLAMTAYLCSKCLLVPAGALGAVRVKDEYARFIADLLAAFSVTLPGGAASLP